MQKLGRQVLVAYGVVTICLVLAFAAVLAEHGVSGVYVFQVPGHGSSLAINFIVFCICWLWLGVLIGVSQYPIAARRHALMLLALVLVSFSYLNMVREPHQVETGDFGAYFHAAVCMRQGQPIEQKPDRLYLYPPLLATVLSPIVGFGMDALAKAFHLLNYVAVVLMAVLLYLALQRYRYTRELAAVAVLCAFVANVPIARTIIYHQINLHVENLILASLLLFGQHNFASAVCLSLASQLKVSPLVLALPFLLEKQWRWCGWFIVSHLCIIAATSAVNSPQYYWDFLHQVGGITETALRNVSVDSLVYNALRLADADVRSGPVAHLLRAVLGLGALLCWVRVKDRPTFTGERGAAAAIPNGYALLPFFMVVVSPSIWEHHFVFLILPVLVLGTAVREPVDFFLFGAAYLFAFLFPVYDIFPVSYLRLVSIVCWLILGLRVARRQDEAAPSWFRDLAQHLSNAAGSSIFPR